jgi:glycosyltransferase involved in cell wall biosynthesis
MNLFRHCARGWRVNVLLPDGRFHQAATYERAHRAISPAQYVHDPTGTPEGRLHALTKALRECNTEVAISVNIPDAMIAVARIKQLDPSISMRAIMSVHGLEPDLFADIEQLAPVLDGVICTNRLAQIRAQACLGIACERVRYAPYGTRAQPPRVPCNKQVLTIGFAGRFERFQKRVQDLAPIANALRARGVAHRWLIAGTGADQQAMDALVGISDLAVQFLGHVEAAHMRGSFYDQCDVLLNTSEWETGPIVVWEAMANSVAVVSSTYVGSGRERALRHDHNCLLYPIGDFEQAAARIAQLVDAQQRARLTAAARELLVCRYTPTRSCGSWAQAISELVAQPPVMGRAPPAAAVGRLDRWFGSTLAYRLRMLCGRSYKHRYAGGEWPHTLSSVARDDRQHWLTLVNLDSNLESNLARSDAALAVDKPPQ